jgi:hypothetical protein
MDVLPVDQRGLGPIKCGTHIMIWKP